MLARFLSWLFNHGSLPTEELAPSQEPKDQGIYTMYHGTSVASARLIIANGFQRSSGGMLGPGVYVSRDQRKADRYPLNSHPSDRVVLELRVRVGRVKCIDRDNHPMQYTWHSHGYDTAWVPPNCGMKAVPSGLEEDCVFDPQRVQVVGIARAPYTNILTQIQQPLSQKFQIWLRRLVQVLWDQFLVPWHQFCRGMSNSCQGLCKVISRLRQPSRSIMIGARKIVACLALIHQTVWSLSNMCRLALSSILTGLTTLCSIPQGNLYSLCNRKIQQDFPHVTQLSWGFGKNICTLMTKHVCRVNA